MNYCRFITKTKSAALFLLIPAAFAATTATPTIKVAPSTATLHLSETKSFSASGAPAGTTFTWQIVSSATGAKPDASGVLGVIDQKGNYTAPATLPANNQILIQYVQTGSPAVVGSAAVTLLNPVASIASLTPNSMNVGLKSTVVLKGTGFLSNSDLQLDGKSADKTKYVIKSATEIDYTDTPTAAAKPVLTVVNPTDGSKASNSVTLTVNPAIMVTLAPDKRTIRGGTALTLSSAVHNHSDQSVTWTVNGKANGDATVGTITVDSKGVASYNAPFAIPGATVTVTAASAIYPTATASITVNLQNPTPTITSVTPNPLIIGTTPSITIAGQGFAVGATVTVAGQPFTISSRNGSTGITGTAAIPALAGHEVSLIVTNPDPGTLASAPFVVPETVAKKCTAGGQPSECMSYTDAFRFLEMASWGPTPASVAHLQEIGRDAWFAEQQGMAPTTWSLATDTDEGAGRIQQEFFNHALMGQDQLRQRVAFALSEIFVVGADKDNKYEAMRTYINDLSTNAFGSYRNLLGVMTLNPAMGWFLDMVNNDKANPAKNTVANENYAREVMQLFSIGLTALNQDGTPTKTPTYDPAIIPEMAKVFTGWTYPTVPDTQGHFGNPQYFGGPMIFFQDHHDTTQKNLVWGTSTTPLTCTINAGGQADADLKQALDCLAKHPNVAPFISYRLIQRLVKSNPTPGYVSDIASVFNSSQGNLYAVVKAILTHSEATAVGSGKLREPVLYSTSLFRALDATVLNQQATGIAGQSEAMGQKVLYSPSVFNYFSPFYRISGVAAPEFQGLNAASGLSRLNFAYRAVNNQVSGNIRVDITKFQDLAGDPSKLIVAINDALYHGAMPLDLQQQLAGIAAEVASETKDTGTLVRTLLYFAAAAPEYQVEQ